MFTDKLQTIKTKLTPSPETTVMLKEAATQIVVGVAISVAVKLTTDVIVEKVHDYRNTETIQPEA